MSAKAQYNSDTALCLVAAGVAVSFTADVYKLIVHVSCLSSSFSTDQLAWSVLIVRMLFHILKLSNGIRRTFVDMVMLISDKNNMVGNKEICKIPQYWTIFD